MNLDLTNLCRELMAVKEGDITPADGVNPYLLKTVLRPAMQGNPPILADIDYNQFGDDDISDLADYCERLEFAARKLEQFVGAVASIKAIAARSRQFC